MNSRIYRYIKWLLIEEQTPYINETIESINKSRNIKRHSGNLASIIKELKQIKEEKLFKPIFFFHKYLD